MKWHGQVMHAPRFVDTQFGRFEDSEIEGDQMDDHFDAEARRREWQCNQGRGPYENDIGISWVFYVLAGLLVAASIVSATYLALTAGLIG
jgi:hypothetical protein